MKKKGKTFMASVKKMGKKKKIPQHILESLCHVIKCEMVGVGNPVKETYDTHLNKAIQAQALSGLTC